MLHRFCLGYFLRKEALRRYLEFPVTRIAGKFLGSTWEHIIWYQSFSVLMAGRLEGKGTNVERLAALEGSVNQVLEASEAHRVEVVTQLQDLTNAVAALTVAVKGPKKKQKARLGSSSSESEDNDQIKEEEFNDSDGSVKTISLKRSRKTTQRRDPLLECRKLKIPIFSREDVHGWVYRVERYFEVHGIGSKDRLQAVAICLEGPPLSWFRWNDAKKPFRS